MQKESAKQFYTPVDCEAIDFPTVRVSYGWVANSFREEKPILILTRRIGQALRIGENVKVTVLGVKTANQVSIGIRAPRSVAVHREELFNQIAQERFAPTEPPISVPVKPTVKVVVRKKNVSGCGLNQANSRQLIASSLKVEVGTFGPHGEPLGARARSRQRTTTARRPR
jgi:carbon storage regulator